MKNEDYEQSLSMIEQRLFSAMLEYLLEVLIVAICFSVTDMKFNYLSRRHERVVHTVRSKHDLREMTERVTTEVVKLLETTKGKSDFADAFFDQAFEKSLVKLIADGCVHEERVAAGDRTRYEYSITEKGLAFYAQAIRPVFGAFLRYLHTIDVDSAEAKGLGKYS